MMLLDCRLRPGQYNCLTYYSYLLGAGKIVLIPVLLGGVQWGCGELIVSVLAKVVL